MPFTKPENNVSSNYPNQVGRLIDIAEGPARRNFIRNGDFQIAQRGTSFAGITTAQYTLDGWLAGHAGTSTVTQESFSVGQTEVPNNPRKAIRVNRTVAAGADNVVLEHRIELPERFSGKTVTVSFWARVASGSKALVFDLASSGVTSAVDTSDNAIALTSAWKFFSATIAVPAMTAATADAYLNVRIREAASFGTFDMYVADAQLELGQEATYFERLEALEQMQWAQRFLPGMNSTANNWPIGSGVAVSGTTASLFVPFSAKARKAVTGISVSAVSDFSLLQAGVTACTDLVFDRGSVEGCEVFATVAAGLTNGFGYILLINAASKRIVFTGAEL